MQVAVALGLIVAELTQEPFRNQLITFHESPKLHTIQGNTLRDRVKDVMEMVRRIVLCRNLYEIFHCI